MSVIARLDQLASQERTPWHRASALAKLKAVVRVGEVINVEVLAECVEEQDVLVRLKALGVGFAQGFGIAEPFAIGKLAATG